MTWIDELPLALKQSITSTISKYPETKSVFEHLHTHLSDKQPPAKKQKTSTVNKEKESTKTPQPADKLEEHESFTLNITKPILESEKIFQLKQISFQSPLRKKLNLVFHLLMEPDAPPEPILSIVAPQTNIPEVSINKLGELIRLCMLLPILGSSMNSKKKVALLCIWLNNSSDPIICQINFELIKVQLIEAGKIPPEQENDGSDSESEDSDEDPIHDAIIDFLQRQFQLCGINLVNHVPSTNPLASGNKNTFALNTDSGIAIDSLQTPNSLVMVTAYKGSKEGSLLLLAASNSTKPYLIFGFKKPILIFELSRVKHISYTNITRITFSLLITIEHEGAEEETLELGMIDQQYYSVLDSFIKGQRINDNSFNDDLREKVKKKDGDDEGDAEGADGGGDNAAGNRAGTELGALLEGQEMAESDDEDEDGTYQVGVEEDEDGSSRASGSDSDSDSDSDIDSGSDVDEEEDSMEVEEAEEEDEEEEKTDIKKE